MKKIALSLSFIFLTLLAGVAQDLSKLGDISKEEAELKQCSFDKEANAVVLLHEAYSDYDGQNHLVTLHHIRIKILNEKAVKEANISIPFYRKNDFEEIDRVEAMTINIGIYGELIEDKVDRKSVYTKETNERFGEVVFAFPAVKTGSILDYKYRSTMKHYGGLDNWYFQEELPVILSRYTVVMLPNTEFTYRVSKRKDLDVVVRPNTDEGSVYFEMRNLPGLQDEPYMDARKDYIQKVIFQLSGYRGSGYEKNNYMTSWEEVNKELLSSTDFGVQLKKNLDADELMNITRSLNTPEQKMKAVYDYVRNFMNWNGVYSKFSPDGIKDAWKKRNSTSGDINLILVNLLNEAGLDAFPVLVSERFHGKVNVDYPFIEQFNSVFACVTINAKNYYLDATDKFCPSHITPPGILNTIGFIVKKKSGELVNITNDSLQYKDDINSFIEVKEDGTVAGNITVLSKDYARMVKMESYKKNTEKFASNYFSNEGLSMKITSSEIRNQGNDTLPLEQEFEFTGALGSSGDYKYIPLNFLPGFKSNPFLSDNRFSNVNFGYPRNINAVIVISLPKDLTVDNIPKPIRMHTPDNSILFERALSYNKEDNLVTCTMNVEFKNSLYAADDYALVKEAYKRIFEYLKEPLLLKKK